jgi:acetyl esterase
MNILDMLEPGARAYMERLRAAGGKPLPDLSVDEARQSLRDRQRTPLEGSGIEVTRLSVEGVRLHQIRPAGVAGPLPAILYLHGGGWVMGSIETHARLVRELALRVHACVIFPEYSLAPEQRFPVAVGECYRSLCWIREHGHEFNIDTERIIIAGDSAGGNLAITTTLTALRRGNALPGLLALICPVTDSRTDTTSYELFADGLNLTKAGMEWFWERYAPDEVQRNDPMASPLKAPLEELAQLPQTLVLTAECDPLRDEAEAFAHLLMRAQVPVQAARFLGTLHNFVVHDHLQDSAPSLAAMEMLVAAMQKVFLLGEGQGSARKADEF